MSASRGSLLRLAMKVSEYARSNDRHWFGSAEVAKTLNISIWQANRWLNAAAEVIPLEVRRDESTGDPGRTEKLYRVMRNGK